MHTDPPHPKRARPKKARPVVARVFAAELRRMFRSRWFVGAVAASILLVAASAVLDCLSYNEWYGYAKIELDSGALGKSYGMQSRLFVHYWTGTDGKPFSAIFYFLLPLICLLPGAGTLIEDRESGFLAHLLSRMSDAPYIVAKAFACFASSACVALIPLMIGILLAFMVGPWGMPDPNELYAFGIPIALDTPFRDLFFTQPGLYLVVWSCVDALLCGVWSVAVLALSLLFKSPVRLFMSVFLAQIFVNYLSIAVNRMVFAGSSKTIDLFTLLHPLGYESTEPILIALAISLVVYVLICVVGFALAFKRRCYL